jgi:2Fe-2S ferredoxin
MRTPFSHSDKNKLENGMPRVTYVGANGEKHSVDVPEGENAMRGALNNMIDGIVGECGGALACATCHVYVDDAWTARVGPPSEMENEMLESTFCERKTSSRLSCQITMRGALDGLVLHLPKAQY